MAAVGGYTAASGGTLAVVGAALAAAGVFLLTAGVVLRLPAFVPWAVLLAGVGYIAGREHHTVVDGWAAVVGAALLLAAELASWSIEHDARIAEERSFVLRRLAILIALVLAAALVGFVLVGAAAVSVTAGLLVTALGVAAAVASVSLVLRLLRT